MGKVKAMLVEEVKMAGLVERGEGLAYCAASPEEGGDPKREGDELVGLGAALSRLLRIVLRSAACRGDANPQRTSSVPASPRVANQGLCVHP
jgi:hypothetical protein